MNKRILLLSGGAAVGKSLLIKRLAARIDLERKRGFFTESVYAEKKRIGFTVNGFNGETCQVAGIHYNNEVRVGKYGVDLAALNAMIRTCLPDLDSGYVYFIDELGKLECLSDYFCRCIDELLAGTSIAIISSPVKGSALLARVASHSDVMQIKVSERNQAQIESLATHWLLERLKSVAQ